MLSAAIHSQIETSMFTNSTFDRPAVIDAVRAFAAAQVSTSSAEDKVGALTSNGSARRKAECKLDNARAHEAVLYKKAVALLTSTSGYFLTFCFA